MYLWNFWKVHNVWANTSPVNSPLYVAWCFSLEPLCFKHAFSCLVFGTDAHRLPLHTPCTLYFHLQQVWLCNGCGVCDWDVQMLAALYTTPLTVLCIQPLGLHTIHTVYIYMCLRCKFSSDTHISIIAHRAMTSSLCSFPFSSLYNQMYCNRCARVCVRICMCVYVLYEDLKAGYTQHCERCSLQNS